MKKWLAQLEVYWDVHRNVPVFKRKRGTVRLPLFEPRDLRPMWEYERENFSKVFDEEIGEGSWEKLTEGRLAFLNKISAPDHAYEIVVDGDILARVLYDPLKDKWKVRLGFLGVKRALEHGFIRKKVIDNPKPGAVVGKGDVNVAIVDSKGRVVGVAIPKGGVIRVDKVWKAPRKGALSTKASTLEDVYEANKDFIEELREWSFEVMEKTKERVVISTSGGKDSALVTQLAHEFGIDAKLMFNDTGLEMPETYKIVKEYERLFGYELEVASAGDTFWRVVNVWSPPARDFRWCCKVCKLAPIGRKLKQMGDVNNYIGTRWWESLERSRAKPIMRMKYFPSVTAVNPILPWPQLLEFLYLMRKGVPLNPLYFKGFDRIGCFMCPGATAWEFKLVKRLHPELWERWEEVLERWRKRLGYGEWWVKGGWRWMLPESPKVALAREKLDWKKELRTRQPLKIESIRINRNIMEVKVKYSLKRVKNLYHVLGIANNNKVVSNNGVYEFDGERVTVKSERREELFEAIRIVYASNVCANCKICETWCPTGAIKVDLWPKVDPKKCKRCRLCMYLCPAADVVAERLVAPFIYNDPKAWRRKERPHAEQIEQLIKSVYGKGGGQRLEKASHIISINSPNYGPVRGGDNKASSNRENGSNPS